MNKKSDISKRCNRCSLDCITVRARSLSKVPESSRREVEAKMFPNAKPIYSRNNCPKIKKSIGGQVSNLGNIAKEPEKAEESE